MIIHREYEQRSQQWLEAHCGVVTASEFCRILTPHFKARTGDMPESYVARKIAEMWGGPLPAHNNFFATEQGQMLEPEARHAVAFEIEREIEEVGFITTDDGKVGCSPDGLFVDEDGVEIKSPYAQTHVGYLLAGVVPEDYRTQVHGCMYVTGAYRWMFVSYRRQYPSLILTIERDEEIQEKIHDAVQPIVARIKQGFERICDLNGGPPPKREPLVFVDEMNSEEDIGITP